MTLTVSYAQTGKPIQDTVKCYGITELRYIASTMIEAKSCDTLLSISKQKLINRDNIIKEKDAEIFRLNKEILIKDNAIAAEAKLIKEINLNLKSEKIKRKWTNYGWIATSVFLGSVIVYVAVH